MKRLVRLLLLLGSPASAHAACSVSAVDIPFGTYYPFSPTPLDLNGSVTVTCTASSGTSPVQVALNIGSVLQDGANFAERKMARGNTYLGFNLYKDAARTIVWGDGTSGSQTVSSPASLAVNGGTVTIPVYGRVRVGQRRYAPPGNYLAVITATLTY